MTTRELYINELCLKASNSINKAKKISGYVKLGLVDFVDSDLIQYEIVGVYESKGGIVLVHKEDSEGAVNGNIKFMHEIESIDKMELIVELLNKL